MASSPHRSRLYRKLLRAVILTMICSAIIGLAQVARRPAKDKGPRALGLIELAENGKAHLIAVTIMIDGRFYDAGAYKADPVPMALKPEIVYETLKSGVPQGLFVVAGAMRGEDGWIADGKWRSTAQIDADKAKAKAESDKRAQKAPPPEQQVGAPPKLKRSPDSSTPPSSPPQNPAPSPSSKSESPGAAQKPAPPPSIEDPNRPMLRRVAPSATAHEQTKATTGPEPLTGPIQFIPAISDADGPDPRPYTYQMKPEEEQAFLKKMLAMAAEEVRGRASHGETAGKSAGKSARTLKPASQPEFQNLQLHVFDLSNGNEPVLVLTANATIPSAHTDLQYIVALVARDDIYGELHKVFAQTTDNQHLDVSPKYDLIDAVDADGDGRGELLFRITSENGSAFGVYRLIGDKLWPLFEGKPGK
jgi:hypothetical protein